MSSGVFRTPYSQIVANGSCHSCHTLGTPQAVFRQNWALHVAFKNCTKHRLKKCM